MWKFCGNAEFPHGLKEIIRNSTGTVLFNKTSIPGNTVKLSVSYAVIDSIAWSIKTTVFVKSYKLINVLNF